MAIILMLLHSLLLLRTRATLTLQTLQQKFSFTVYLKDDADPLEVGNLITDLESRTDVIKPVVYTSKEEALAGIRTTFSLDTESLAKYGLSLPASLTIRPRDPANTSAIYAFLEKKTGHLINKSKDGNDGLTERMVEFLRNLRGDTLGTILLVIVFFLIGGGLLLSNTIHMAITARHREIMIMKILGASRQRIMAPFMVESVLLGSAAFILHLLFSALLPLPFLELPNISTVLLMEFLAVMLLSSATSYFTCLISICSRRS